MRLEARAIMAAPVYLLDRHVEAVSVDRMTPGLQLAQSGLRQQCERPAERGMQRHVALQARDCTGNHGCPPAAAGTSTLASVPSRLTMTNWASFRTSPTGWARPGIV